MYNTSQCTFFDAIYDQSRAAIFQFTIGKIAQVPALEATRINLLAQILPSIVCQVKSRSGFEILRLAFKKELLPTPNYSVCEVA
jgi:hypothetical protein